MTRLPSVETDAGRTVAIVGGGISGLTAARRFSQRGIRVTLFEAGTRLGGQIRTAAVAGHPVDVGAEAVHASAAGMNTLIAELGLTDGLIHANRGTSWLWTQRGPPAANGLVVEVDAVVLAVPAAIAADLIRPLSTNAANLLGRVRYASVGTAVVAYPRAAVRQIRALTRTGLLVPSSRGRLLKAATFLSAKWPHLADPTHVLVRLSGGRAGAREICELDDAALAARLHSDLVDATGMTAKPAESHVQRWPCAMPQLEVGHLDRVASVREDLRRYPGLTLAGASYDGLGIAACVRSGERAATSCLPVAGADRRATS